MSNTNNNLVEKNQLLAEMCAVLLRKYDVKEALERQGIKSYILWGAGQNGRIFLQWTKQCGIEAKKIVDINAGIIIDGIKVSDPESVEYEADAIIVTPIEAFSEIRNYLKDKTTAQVISLKELIEEFMVCPIRNRLA